MEYKVILYYNTGFNGINVPSEQSIIENCTHSEFDAININQAGMINNVAIRATWSDVRDADYLCIYKQNSEKWFYTINSISMTSPDVAIIGITLDPWTTIDGVNGIDEFLDGMTVRHHVGTSDDTFGAYVEPDPLLVPSKALELESAGKVVDINYHDDHSEILIEATTDLVDMATNTLGIEYLANGGNCVVPQIKELPGRTDIEPPSNTGMAVYRTPQSQYFRYSDPDVKTGIARARSLGVETCILNAWCTPSNDAITSGDGKHVTTISFTFDTVNTGLNFYFANVHNNRILYGELCKYVLLSPASGNTIAFDPEDIYNVGDTAPNVKYIADPRPNGTPLFRFEYYLGDNSNIGFFQNCISGLPNPTAPLVYQDKSGSELDRMRFNTKMSIANEDQTVNFQKSIMGEMASPLVDFDVTHPFRVIKNLVSGTLAAGNLGHIAFDGGEPISDVSTSSLSESANMQRQFKQKLAEEMQEFKLNTQVVAPEMQFPRSETIRDFVGNGLYAYRLKPSATDINKFDKILTMYGYKDTMPVDKSLLTKRSKFSYIQVAGPSIKTKDSFYIPLWLRNLVNTQLSVGLRIWKDTPDTSYYTNGQNV